MPRVKPRTPEELEAMLERILGRLDRLEDTVNFLLRSRTSG